MRYVTTQVNQNGLVYGTFSDMVTKRHLNGRKQTVSIRNFGHSITAPYTAPYFPSDTVTIRLFTYINGPYYCARKYGPYYCARKYGPYRSTWVVITFFCSSSSIHINRVFFLESVLSFLPDFFFRNKSLSKRNGVLLISHPSPADRLTYCILLIYLLLYTKESFSCMLADAVNGINSSKGMKNFV